MRRLKTVFPDSHGLHRRIDLYLAHSSVPRVALIPYKCTREKVSGFLDNLVADPLGDGNWMPILKDRSFAKDTLVRQSSSFDFVETRNSIVEYPVPFGGKPVEYVEVVSEQGSQEHLDACHLWVYLTTSTSASLPSREHPHFVAVDDKTAAYTASPPPEDVLPVNVSRATEANDLLRESPKNVTDYLDEFNTSGFAALKFRVTDRESIYEHLKESILATCERLLPEDVPKVDVTRARDLRAQWSKEAHHELQSVLSPTIETTFTHSLNWYKLYAKTDDVETVLQARLSTAFLPQSRESLAYLVGQLGGQPKDIKTVEKIWRSSRDSLVAASTMLQNQALWSVLTVVGTIQLPLASLAVAGSYFLHQPWYTMTAVGMLGIVAGLRRLQSAWLTATKAYSQLVEETTKTAINESERALFDLGESQAEDVDTVRQKMLVALDDARAEDNDSI